MILVMNYDKNDESIKNSLENSEAPRPLSEVTIPKKKKMSRKERRHTDFPGDPVSGRAFFGWSRFFFVLTCIGVGLTGLMIILPFFLVVVGLFSALLWIIAIFFLTVFTLGMIWISSDIQTVSGNWMAFNNMLFDSSNNTANFALSVIPIILISGGIIIGITWMFLIIGRILDEARKKKYKGFIIALSVFTALYIIFLILNLLRMQVYADSLNGSSSIIDGLKLLI